jgi:hypothetical protein
MALRRRQPKKSTDAGEGEVFVIDTARTALVSLRSSLHRYSKAAITQLPTDKPWPLWVAALLITLAVHVLLVSSIVLGTGKQFYRPMTEGFHAVEKNADGTEFVSALLFVKDTSIRAPDQDDASAYSTPKEAPDDQKTSFIVASTENGQPQIPSLDGLIEDASQSAEEAGDGAEAAMLFGRYMGQIKARIERAWIYPTTAKHARFNCKAQIRQSKNGNVQEITLQQCDMDGMWQASLLKAIQGASPLSAPPSEMVFTDVVTLGFSAEAEQHAERTATAISINQFKTDANAPTALRHLDLQAPSAQKITE